MSHNQTGYITTLDGAYLKLVDKFTYLGSSVLSTEKVIDTRVTKAWTAIDRLSIIWKSDPTDKMKPSYFQAAVVSILLYGCTTWTLTKRLKKKLDGNYTRMLRAILNKPWRQHPTIHQLYGHVPPITKTIQFRRTRHAGHCWRSKDELISDVLLWIPAYGQAKAGRAARTYIQQLCEDTGCNPEDLPKAMNDREKWRDRVSDIRACGRTWWWWIESNLKNSDWLYFILYPWSWTPNEPTSWVIFRAEIKKLLFIAYLCSELLIHVFGGSYHRQQVTGHMRTWEESSIATTTYIATYMACQVRSIFHLFNSQQRCHLSPQIFIDVANMSDYLSICSLSLEPPQSDSIYI